MLASLFWCYTAVQSQCSTAPVLQLPIFNVPQLLAAVYSQCFTAPFVQLSSLDVSPLTCAKGRANPKASGSVRWTNVSKFPVYGVMAGHNKRRQKKRPASQPAATPARDCEVEIHRKSVSPTHYPPPSSCVLAAIVKIRSVGRRAQNFCGRPTRCVNCFKRLEAQQILSPLHPPR